MANELTILSTTALKTSLDSISAGFTSQTGLGLAPSYAPSTQIARRVGAGERADVVIATAAGVRDLTGSGQVADGTAIDIASSAIGVAVPLGAPRPDLSGVVGFKRALLDARTIATSNPDGGGQSGIHIQQVFERLGIADVLARKLKYGAGGPAGLIGLFLLRGEADLGIQQMSELMAVPGIDIVGPLPHELQSVTMFTLGRLAGCAQPEAATAFADYLRTPEVRAVLAANGLTPA